MQLAKRRRSHGINNMPDHFHILIGQKHRTSRFSDPGPQISHAIYIPHAYCGLYRKEKIGQALYFVPGKVFTEMNNFGRIVVVSPNTETVTGWFSSNPSGPVMTPPLRSPAVLAKLKSIRHCVRVFPPTSQTILPAVHTA